VHTDLHTNIQIPVHKDLHTNIKVAVYSHVTNDKCARPRRETKQTTCTPVPMTMRLPKKRTANMTWLTL